MNGYSLFVLSDGRKLQGTLSRHIFYDHLWIAPGPTEPSPRRLQVGEEFVAFDRRWLMGEGDTRAAELECNANFRGRPVLLGQYFLPERVRVAFSRRWGPLPRDAAAAASLAQIAVVRLRVNGLERCRVGLDQMDEAGAFRWEWPLGLEDDTAIESHDDVDLRLIVGARDGACYEVRSPIYIELGVIGSLLRQVAP